MTTNLRVPAGLIERVDDSRRQRVERIDSMLATLPGGELASVSSDSDEALRLVPDPEVATMIRDRRDAALDAVAS